MTVLTYFISYMQTKYVENAQNQPSRVHISWIKDEADALPCHFHISVCLRIMDPDCRVREKNAGFEMRCYRKLLNILYKDHVTNEEVRRKTQTAIGEYDELLTLVKKRKIRWFGHVSRSSGLAKTILQGTVKGKKKKRQTEEEVGRQYQRQDRNGLCLLN